MKAILFTVLFSCWAVFSSAQQLLLGGRFDATAMKWTFSDNYRVPLQDPFTSGEVKSLWGFQMGIPLELRLNKWLGIQTELGFAKRGFALKLKGYDSGCTIGATAKTIFRYFDFPILLKTYLAQGEKEFYLLAGPSWSKVRNGKIQVNVTVTCGTDSERDSDSEPLDLDDFPKAKTDFGLYAGLGFSKGDSRLRFFLEGRYYYGLKKQSDEGADETIYNRGVMFATGLMFSLFHR